MLNSLNFWCKVFVRIVLQGVKSKILFLFVFNTGAAGEGERRAGHAERDVPAGLGETERVHQSSGKRKGTLGIPEKVQEEDD